MASLSEGADNTDTSSSQSQAASSTEIQEPAMLSYCNRVPWIVRPSPGINYDFVLMMYLAGSAFAVFFYALEKHVFPSIFGGGGGEGDDQNSGNSTSFLERAVGADGNDAQDGGGDAWKEFATSMEGMYLIFVPFIPCLLWSFVVRLYWLRETRVSSLEKKEN